MGTASGEGGRGQRGEVQCRLSGGIDRPGCTFSAKKSFAGPQRKWLNIGKTMCCSTRRSHMLILAFSMGVAPHSFSSLP